MSWEMGRTCFDDAFSPHFCALIYLGLKTHHRCVYAVWSKNVVARSPTNRALVPYHGITCISGRRATFGGADSEVPHTPPTLVPLCAGWMQGDQSLGHIHAT